MTKKLNWRLSKLPTPDEVRELVKDKIITQDEAREILFSSETQEERDKDSLQAEIKFLRELIAKLANSRTTIVKTIREVQKPWARWEWYRPYEVWCGIGSGTTNYQNLAVGSSAGSNATFQEIDKAFSNL